MGSTKMLDAPPAIASTFAKPGWGWTAREREDVKVWLNTPPELLALLGYTALHLGWGTTAEDAEETWNEFNVRELDYTIASYDPSKSYFVTWLLLRLRQFCWKAGERIRKRAGVETPSDQPTDSQDGPVELEFADPKAMTEGDIVDGIDLIDAIKKLPTHERRVIEMSYFLGLSDEDIAQELGVRTVSVRVYKFRARQRLRRALQAVDVGR